MSNLVLSRTSGSTREASFLRDRKGGAAVMFALVSPVALLAIAGVSGYAFNLQYRADVKAAIDGAALTATQQLARDSSTDVNAVGQAYFRANAPAGATDRGTLKIDKKTDGNGVILITASYSGATTQFLGGFVANSSLPVNATSQLSLTYNGATNSSSNSSSSSSNGSSGGGASSSNGSSMSPGGNGGGLPSGGYSGNGSIGGDPSISVGGKTYTLACGATAQWYNMLSDGGLQVNASCLQDPNNPGTSYINAVNILFNGHSIYVNAQTPNYLNGVPDYTSAPVWWGDIAFDGTYYPAPKTMPATVDSNGNIVAGVPCGYGSTFNGGTAIHLQNVCTTNYLGSSVRTFVEDLNDIYVGNNYVQVSNGHGYSVFVSYGAGARAHIDFMAMGVGAQGAPGGFWGQTMTGGTDNNPANFLFDATTPTGNSYQGATYPASTTASGANGVGPQYAWSWPAPLLGGITNANAYGSIKQIQ